MRETNITAQNLAGFRDLKEEEMKECRGGLGWVVSALLALGSSFISNFGDVREGFSDGIQNKSPRY